MNGELKIETRCDAKTTINGVKHVSHVTIDWTGMTVEEVQELAQRSLIIRKQNEDRTNGIVPETNYVLKAADYKLGIRRQRVEMTPEQAIAKLSDEQLLAILKAKGLV